MSDLRHILDEHTRKHVELFEQDSTSYIESLIISKEKRALVLWFYNRMVAQKRILKITEQPYEYKKEIWETAQQLAGEKLKDQPLVTFSVCLYLMMELSNTE